MIKPICFRCKNEINDFAGLLISPPVIIKDKIMNKYIEDLHKKTHLCGDCYNLVLKFINQYDIQTKNNSRDTECDSKQTRPDGCSCGAIH